MTDNMTDADKVKNAMMNKVLNSVNVIEAALLLAPKEESYSRGLLEGSVETFGAFAEYLNQTSSEQLVKEYEGDNATE